MCCGCRDKGGRVAIGLRDDDDQNIEFGISSGEREREDRKLDGL